MHVVTEATTLKSQKKHSKKVREVKHVHSPAAVKVKKHLKHDYYDKENVGVNY